MPDGSIAPPRMRLVVVAVVGGILSGLLGVGGGVIMVPLLVLWLGYDQRTAHALSLGAIIPISVAGVATYGIAGEVELAAAAALIVGAVVGARAGAIVLAGIDPRRLQVVFGLFLFGVSVTMVAGA
jgi:uncharacterized membrane protein YfcA